MEWVETTARGVEEAKDLALDQLGVSADEAEFEILEEPRPGLFGRLRGEARVRARVRPAAVRPKQQRRGGNSGRDARSRDDRPVGDTAGEAVPERGARGGRNRRRGPQADTPAATGSEARQSTGDGDGDGEGASSESSPTGATVEDVRTAAEVFVTGLVAGFGFDASVTSKVVDEEIDVSVNGDGLGVMIGPGGRTLLAIQDLTRVAAQRRLGDHTTRLRVDAAGYREKRRHALERFARSVADQVIASGVPRSLDPMPSADRKVIHDALAAIDGVASRSEGEEPSRRIVVSPG